MCEYIHANAYGDQKEGRDPSVLKGCCGPPEVGTGTQAKVPSARAVHALDL